MTAIVNVAAPMLPTDFLEPSRQDLIVPALNRGSAESW
jgi:hypothetical protein